MVRLATSIFLVALLFDIASSINPNPCNGGHEPPSGVRRMIETLENKKRGATVCALERSNRSAGQEGTGWKN